MLERLLQITALAVLAGAFTFFIASGRDTSYTSAAVLRPPSGADEQLVRELSDTIDSDGLIDAVSSALEVDRERVEALEVSTEAPANEGAVLLTLVDDVDDIDDASRILKSAVRESEMALDTPLGAMAPVIPTSESTPRYATVPALIAAGLAGLLASLAFLALDRRRQRLGADTGAATIEAPGTLDQAVDTTGPAPVAAASSTPFPGSGQSPVAPATTSTPTVEIPDVTMPGSTGADLGRDTADPRSRVLPSFATSSTEAFPPEPATDTEPVRPVPGRHVPAAAPAFTPSPQSSANTPDIPRSPATDSADEAPFPHLAPTGSTPLDHQPIEPRTEPNGTGRPSSDPITAGRTPGKVNSGQTTNGTHSATPERVAATASPVEIDLDADGGLPKRVPGTAPASTSSRHTVTSADRPPTTPARRNDVTALGRRPLVVEETPMPAGSATPSAEVSASAGAVRPESRIGGADVAIQPGASQPDASQPGANQPDASPADATTGSSVTGGRALGLGELEAAINRSRRRLAEES